MNLKTRAAALGVSVEGRMTEPKLRKALSLLPSRDEDPNDPYVITHYGFGGEDEEYSRLDADQMATVLTKRRKSPSMPVKGENMEPDEKAKFNEEAATALELAGEKVTEIADARAAGEEIEGEKIIRITTRQVHDGLGGVHVKGDEPSLPNATAQDIVDAKLAEFV